MTEFDPYQTWLDISPGERPPNHYRLLGLRPRESDPQVIAAAAERTIAHFRSLSPGPHAKAHANILAELEAARACLLDPVQKQQYDATLSGAAVSGERPISPPPLTPGRPATSRPPTEQPMASPPLPGRAPGGETRETGPQIKPPPPVPGAAKPAASGEQPLAPPTGGVGLRQTADASRQPSALQIKSPPPPDQPPRMTVGSAAGIATGQTRVTQPPPSASQGAASGAPPASATGSHEPVTAEVVGPVPPPYLPAANVPAASPAGAVPMGTVASGVRPVAPPPGEAVPHWAPAGRGGTIGKVPTTDENAEPPLPGPRTHSARRLRRKGRRYQDRMIVMGILAAAAMILGILILVAINLSR